VGPHRWHLKKGGEMYETKGSMPMGESECRPDYEARAKQQANELSVIKDFHQALLNFIQIVRPHHRSENGLAQLLGTVVIDIMERERELERTLELVEKYK